MGIRKNKKERKKDKTEEGRKHKEREKTKKEMTIVEETSLRKNNIRIH